MRKALLLLTSLSCSAAAPPATRCPAAVEGHGLSDFGVFDGAPSNQADLIGEQGVFLVDRSRAADPAGFTLSCKYQDGRVVVVVPIPAGAKRCEVGSARPASIVCR